MRADANLIPRNAINGNQERRMIEYAKAFLRVAEFASNLMRADWCKHVWANDVW